MRAITRGAFLVICPFVLAANGAEFFAYRITHSRNAVRGWAFAAAVVLIWVNYKQVTAGRKRGRWSPAKIVGAAFVMPMALICADYVGFRINQAAKPERYQTWVVPEGPMPLVQGIIRSGEPACPPGAQPAIIAVRESWCFVATNFGIILAPLVIAALVLAIFFKND